MRAARIVVTVLLFLGVGVMIGGIVAGIVTGDGVYTFVWTGGMGVAVLAVCAFPILALRGRPGAGSSVVPPAPPSRGRRAVRRGGYALAAVVGLVAALAPGVATAASGGLDDMITGHHQTVALDAIAAAAGHHEVAQVDLDDDKVIVDAPTAAGASTIDTWIYEHGRVEHDGPEPIQPHDPRAAVFDARTVDFSAVPGLVAHALKLARIGHPTDLLVDVQRPITDLGAAPRISVSIHDAYHDATVDFALDGSVVSTSGSAFE